MLNLFQVRWNPPRLSRRRALPLFTLVAYRPLSDIDANGWTATPGGALYSCIDEVTLDNADFISSPDLGTPTTIGIPAMPAGTYDLRIAMDRDAPSGSLRAVLLDAGGATVGISAWQVVTATITTYTLSVTISGTATQIRLEVSP